MTTLMSAASQCGGDELKSSVFSTLYPEYTALFSKSPQKCSIAWMRRPRWLHCPPWKQRLELSGKFGVSHFRVGAGLMVAVVVVVLGVLLSLLVVRVLW